MFPVGAVADSDYSVGVVLGFEQAVFTREPTPAVLIGLGLIAMTALPSLRTA